VVHKTCKDTKHYLSISSFHRSVCRNAEHLVTLLYIIFSFAVRSWILTDLHRIVASSWIQNEVIYIMFSYETSSPLNSGLETAVFAVLLVQV